jgi:hypothetical protein
LFDINLNGNNWNAHFTPDLLGQFKLSHFHLSNFTSIAGDLQSGAFNGSSFSLKTVHMESSNSERSNRNVDTGAFSKLQSLSSVNLGNSFGSFKSKSFFDLPNLKHLLVDEKTLTTIEAETFHQLPKLKTLDLSNQLLGSLPSRSFCNLSNLTKIDLSKNMIKNIKEDTFYNLPSLLSLDLSKNSYLCHIRNTLDHLPNPDLAVDLSETHVKVLLQDTFKKFVERVSEKRGKGFLNFSSVPLQCTCDVKWLLVSNLEWKNVFQNTSCLEGIKLEEASGF